MYPSLRITNYCERVWNKSHRTEVNLNSIYEILSISEEKNLCKDWYKILKSLQKSGAVLFFRTKRILKFPGQS